MAVSDLPARGWRYLEGGLLAEAGGVHAAKLLLEIGDLVPESGGQLKLQLPRGAHHLVGELLHQIRELGSGHRRGVPSLQHASATAGPTGFAGGAFAPGGIAAGSADLHRNGLRRVAGLGVDAREYR